MILAAVATLILRIGMSLAIGSSTYAIAFYLKATRDGVITDTERDFMHTVYFVLRIGMALIIVGELALLALAFQAGALSALLAEPTFWFKWGLILTIGLNAILMHKHMMPMGIGPAIAGGSWYMYLVADTLGSSNITLPIWMLLYALFIGGFTILLRMLKKMTVSPSASIPQKAA